MLAIDKAAALIFFREVFEITLIVGMVIAATKGVARRNFWVACGLITSIACSLAMAYFANIIANFGEGSGQELINIVILTLATITISWTVIWMRQQVTRNNANIRKLGQDLSLGNVPTYTIAMVIFVAVIREGAEITLLLHGLLKSSRHQVNYWNLVTSLSTGGIIGIVLGQLFYLGLISIPKKYIFSVTSLLLTLLAAGMASQIPNSLQAIGILDMYFTPLWDTSSFLSESSIIGQIFHLLVGYTARPSLPQVIFYLATLFTICGLLYRQKKNT